MSRSSIIAVCLLALLCLSARATEHAAPLHIYSKTLFSVPVRVQYDPRYTRIIDRPFNDGSMVRSHLVLRTRLDANEPKEYDVYFSEGASKDFGFFFSPAGRTDEWLRSEHTEDLWGTELRIASDRLLFLSGHVNSMYVQKKVLRYSSGVLTQLAQPLYFVGLTAPTLAQLTIYSDKGRTTELLTIPANSTVTVLAADGESYLIKTSLGIVGWAHIPDRQQATMVKGLFYNGD